MKTELGPWRRSSLSGEGGTGGGDRVEVAIPRERTARHVIG
ncbi:hypothetical protein CLV71_104105 [Actinophytocola oryzae]|uniref:Uncharacterized protein n=1 Tax=Actinophytocola oryzae TaxID=502181 RepID=A0A4R7VWN6_9PSEU|nr:hypothetical protein CLV71_104105 [Actinophytocola oryzae]